jgi:hypothetical protein
VIASDWSMEIALLEPMHNCENINVRMEYV